MEEKKSFWKKPGVQTVLTSLICIFFGLLIGYIVLLIINPAGAGEAIKTIILSFMTRPTSAARIKALGNTLVKTAPLLMCALSVCFAYKVGLFNIGAAGQYEVGACACLTMALLYHLPWYVCMIGAAAAGALLGFISGALKAYKNVNEVISGIMLNWIFLYVTNTVLGKVKEPTSPYTEALTGDAAKAKLPTLGLENLFANNRNVTIAIFLAVLTAVIVWIVLDKTKFGYELKATGFNKEAARYAGMKEKKNIIITLVISGAIAGLGASFMYQSGYMRWETTASSVPGMGFNGIAATFLGGLNPIGTIFASFFIQSITDGGSMIDRMIYPSQVSDLMSGIIIYLSGFVLFFKYLMNKPRTKKNKAETKTGGEAK
jgi:simple sugar transport system permease protein